MCITHKDTKNLLFLAELREQILVGLREGIHIPLQYLVEALLGLQFLPERVQALLIFVANRLLPFDPGGLFAKQLLQSRASSETPSRLAIRDTVLLNRRVLPLSSETMVVRPTPISSASSAWERPARSRARRRLIWKKSFCTVQSYSVFPAFRCRKSASMFKISEHMIKKYIFFTSNPLLTPGILLFFSKCCLIFAEK